MKIQKVFVPLLAAVLMAGCAEKGRRNDLHPLTDNSFDEECPQHIVITADSVKPFETVENEACLHVDLPQEMTETCLDTVFSSYTFVPLETKEECLIGQITKIIKCPGCYCILDRDNANVFLFEEDGRFRCKLGNKGHAGNEHLDAWNIAYDSENRYVVMLDLTGRRLLSYDLEGKLQKVTPLYFLYTDMAYTSAGVLCLTGTSSNSFSDIVDLSQLVLADRNQKPLRIGFLVSEERRHLFSWESVLQQFEDEVCFRDLVSDTIWTVSGVELVPLLITSINGRESFTQEEKASITDAVFKERNAGIPYVISCFLTRNYIVMSIAVHHLGGRVMTLLVDRSKGQCRIVGESVDSKRFGDFMSMNGLNGVYDDSTLIRVLNPGTILTDIRMDLPSVHTMTAEEKRLLMNVQLDDNPVLMLEHLVKF